MPANADRQRFLNEDLLLKISLAVDYNRWDESRYEPFIDELCGDREYQKEALRTTLRYLLGGEYADLRALAKANYDTNRILERRYGLWAGMERHLQLPDQLAASLDLATGTGKSYVLYGLAAILLAEGAVDRVLVLCPSTTIESGLLEKFRQLAGNGDLRDLLPPGARIAAPSIINASQSITDGSICVENYHAILEHVGSSIRDSLTGVGGRTLVLNDETHHVVNETTAKTKRWKEFLTNPDYGFRMVIGVSGTCYVGDDYFADVIFRYSLRQAMEQHYVKRVDYVAEMPRTGDPDEKWQLIFNRHEETRRKLTARHLRPLSIIVTPSIARCKDVADELRAFLAEQGHASADELKDQILVVYNGASDIPKLRFVDHPTSRAEWIVSVSMLNEGWDVKRVFQIIPHEERAFNSKLLIAQVLGRGLRVPVGWTGEEPTVTVFNHDAWAPRIRHLVNEILEIEKRLTSHIVIDSPNHFELLNINYTLEPTRVRVPMTGEYTIFAKGYVDLAYDRSAEDVTVEFERAGAGDRYRWQTRIERKTHSPHEIAEEMHRRLQGEDEYNAEDPDPAAHTSYAVAFPVDRLERIVRRSLTNIDVDAATESMKQKFLQSLGTLRRRSSENVRYTPIANRYFTLSTHERHADSVSAAELHGIKTFFGTEQTRGTLLDEQVEFFDEVSDIGAGGFNYFAVPNPYNFKTPLNAAIADSQPERRFIYNLVQRVNLPYYDAWIKSTAVGFYEIAYWWKKGEHPKRSKFSPDFFIKAGDLIVVVEVKGDGDLREPSEENRKKNEYALAHFDRINEHLRQQGSSVRYKFTFLNEGYINKFFQSLREGTIVGFRSELDVRLTEEG